jgi:urease accessory protein
MSDQLVVLLHLCDSLFPLGSFAHSDGLEAATTSGQIRTAGDLRAWMQTVLEVSLERCDAPAVRSAREAFLDGNVASLACIDAEVYALRPSSAGRAAGRAMGSRLIKTWQQIRPEDGVEPVVGSGAAFMLPTAFGIVAAAATISAKDAVEAFMYTRLAAVVSSAMRLMPLGQREGHTMLAQLLGSVPTAAARVLAAPRPLQSFAPALDLATMNQQYGHSRLFRS